MERSVRAIDWSEQRLRELSRVSSRDRGWRGFDASLIRVAGGASQTVVLGRHNITMLAGSPLRTLVRCDDLVGDRLQRPGDFDILPSRSYVSWIDEGDGLFLAVGLNHELLCEVAFAMRLQPEKITITPRLTHREPRVEHILWALKAELEADEPEGRLYAESLGVALAAQLLRPYASSLRKPIASGLPNRRLRRVLAYIQERLAGDLSLAEIAEVAGISPSHFKLLFKQSVGVPVHRYVLQKRIERAAELLTRTQIPLCDVALQAGFANQSHMALCLRRSIGLTPKALRDAI
jgi:AraC family transcriptional regulator